MPNLTQEQLNLQLFEAIEANDINAVIEAIQAGADVNAWNYEDRCTPHCKAIWCGHYEIAKFLEQHGGV